METDCIHGTCGSNCATYSRCRLLDYSCIKKYVSRHYPISATKSSISAIRGLVLQHLVTYIVALTIIMQNIFVLTTNGNSVVSTRLIKIALKIFLESSQQNVICFINEEFQRLEHFGRDAILQKMTELLELKSNRVSPEEMADAKTQLENIDLGSDELW
jgi:hypothetical protein